ncbi:hypothetical protein KYB31_15560 [Clostridium felsineum]|uniref:hypothetical protein n=1 Tax=Clostridium felsineum TaxID=36839 RepID=UPI00214D930C|nr:hypothetical protein [Clostridium felsineum]MCR3760394.1 hypothetical protein [Clostridium felsineum]
MNKPTPKQQGLWTYNMLQKRKAREAKLKERGDMEARQFLIVSSITANKKYNNSKPR